MGEEFSEQVQPSAVTEEPTIEKPKVSKKKKSSNKTSTPILKKKSGREFKGVGVKGLIL